MDKFALLTPAQQKLYLATKPGIAPPKGQVSKFNDPPTRNDIVIIVMSIGVFIAMVTGALRLYSRTFTSKRFRAEDYIGLASYLLYVAVIVMQALITARVGFLVDQWNIHLGTYLDLIFYLYIYRIVYCLLMIFVKTAILLEWQHIFIPTRERNWFFWAASAMIVLNVTAYIAAIILISVSCLPTAKAWKPWIPGRCFDRAVIDILTAWINLAMDLAILVLPQPIIWRLNMNRKRKWGVSLVFSVGLIVVACACGRIHSNMILDYHGNTSHDASMNAIWAFCEASTVMVVFSAPAIPKAFSRETFLGGLTHSFQSWARLGDSKGSGSASSGSKENRSWRATIGGGGSAGQKRKPKQSLTDLDLMETQNSEQIELEYSPHHQQASSNGRGEKRGFY